MLPRDLIKKLRRIEIITARAANNQLAGAYHSVFKGVGIAFSEVRQYQPGDDVRSIDWNVTARMRDAYIKVFVEEREMTVMLLVDASGSGLFGSREQSKREVAAEVAALLAFSAIKNNDSVGLIIFTDRVERFVPPKKGKKHVLRVIREILTFPGSVRDAATAGPDEQPGEPGEPRQSRDDDAPVSRGTDLGVALDFLGRVARRRSVAFLVSDFLADGYERSLRIAARRHDVVPVTLTDPLEEALPRLGVVTLEDPETGELVEFDTLGRGRLRYAERVKRARMDREQLFKRLRLDFVNVRTDAPYLNPLMSFFRTRERRLRH